MDKILEEIKNEREYQKNKWGGPEVDAENNSPADFVLYITHYATKWFKGGLPPHNTEAFRESMIKVATLAVAAIEAQEHKQ
jgi:hypothetical protein